MRPWSKIARAPFQTRFSRATTLRPDREAGRLQFALDVTAPEPLPPGHPLWQSPGVLISPHVGGNTSAFLPRVARLVDEQARRWISGESVLHVIVS